MKGACEMVTLTSKIKKTLEELDTSEWMLECSGFLVSLVNSANFGFTEGTKLFQEFSSAVVKFSTKKSAWEILKMWQYSLFTFPKYLTSYLEILCFKMYQSGAFLVWIEYEV